MSPLFGTSATSPGEPAMFASGGEAVMSCAFVRDQARANALVCSLLPSDAPYCLLRSSSALCRLCHIRRVGCAHADREPVPGIGQRFSPRQGRSLAIGIQVRLVPCSEEIQSCRCLAELARFFGVHVQAVCAAIDLRYAGLDERDQSVIEAAGLHIVFNV